MKNLLKGFAYCIVFAAFVVGFYVTIGMYGEYRQSKGYFIGIAKGKAKCIQTSVAIERDKDWLTSEY